MKGQSDNRRRLASLLNDVAAHEGVHRTLVVGVEVARVPWPAPRAPVVYQPKILVVGQGRKRAYLGDEKETDRRDIPREIVEEHA